MSNQPLPPDDDHTPDGEEAFVDLTPEGDEPAFDPATDFAAMDPAEGEIGAPHLAEHDELDDGDDAGEPESPELAAARAELAELTTKHADVEGKLLRTAADFQNFVRRSAQNEEDAKQQTLMKVAKALVPVLDNFDRALELDPETTSALDLLKGSESIRATLLQALAGFGLSRLDVAAGDDFDPNLHEALMRQPSEDVESGQVAMQLMPGYVLNEQPVRPAQVGVAE